MKSFFHWVNEHKIVSLVILVVAGYGIYASFFQQETSVVSVETRNVPVSHQDVRVVVSGSGQIEANSQVDLKSVRAGDGVDILSVPVKNDQEVKKGQIIAVLDSSDVARTVAQARLSLASAEIKLKQTEDTYDTKTDDDRRTRQLQEITVSQSRISLEDAEETLSDYTIRAPFDGIVTGLSVEGGDSLSNETVIASVITKEMKAVISLNEVDAAKVKVGDKAALTFNALPNLQVSGTISKLDTIGTTSSGVVSYGAEITLDDQPETLKPGMSMTAEITVAEKKNALVVPSSALTSQDGKTFVTLSSGEKKAVETGMTDNTVTEIVSGLSEKDTVQVSGNTATSTSTTGNSQSRSQGNVLNSLFRGNTRTTR
jgi:macrolide-specific efflux system membrane fusion protein